MLLYLYLNDIFQGIIGATSVLTVLFTVFIIFLPMWADLLNLSGKDVVKSFWFKAAAITLAVLTLTSILLPSRITLYTLAANELVQEVKDTPEVKAIREYITTELTKAVEANKQEKK